MNELDSYLRQLEEYDKKGNHGPIYRMLVQHVKREYGIDYEKTRRRP